jgi:DNA (cytosine-5)-methyltransferase 1
MGQGGHNVPIIKDAKGIRRLTPAECARLQGYNDLHVPLGLSDQQIYKQIGNSVTVPVIQAVAESVLAALKAYEGREAKREKELAYI